jgi:hypothetical protein
MTPFLNFRTWLHGGPAGERLLTGTAALLLLSLLVWASVPTPQDGSGADTLGFGGTEQQFTEEQVANGEVPAGTTDAGVAGGAGTVSGGAGSAPGTATGSGGSVSGTTSGGTTFGGTTTGGASTGGTAAGPEATGTTGQDCGPLTATDNGVTAKDITVGVVVVDLGGASGLINLPTAEEVRKAYNAVIEDVNAKGGVRCRKLKAKFYTDSVFDQSQERAACLQMAEDKVFAAFNNMFNTTEKTCIAKQKIPNIWYTTPLAADVKRYAPYILSWHPHYDQLIKHYVQGAKAQGWFTGMKRVGILEQSCFPDQNTAIRRELQSIGIKLDDVSVFNYGCDQAAAAPEKDQAAALQFKREGVTHVMNVAYAFDGSFSRAADQQDYDPEFAHMEDASATAIETGTSKPGDSYDGALLISAIETGARNTPGYKYNKASQDCTAVMQKAGLPGPAEEPEGLYFGVACVNVAMFKAAAEKAPSLLRSQLSTGLSRVGQLELPFPAGPAIFNSAEFPTGGQQWRPGKWFTSCQCWRVTDVRYRPGY